MKMTLLEMVQDILSDMDGDVVNSVSDTPDSMQVAQILKTTYYELLALSTWPHTGSVMQLQASTDINKPNYLRLPEDVYEMKEVWYDTRDAQSEGNRYTEIHFVPPSDFLKLTSRRHSENEDVEVVEDFSGAKLNILNNKAPQWCTSFDDEWLVLDAWDKEVDDTLQSSKSQAMVFLYPDFLISNNFVPDMPAKYFPYYLSEAKSVAFNALKQLPNQKEEQRSRRQRTRLVTEKRRTHNYLVKSPNYGRHR